MAIPYNGHIIYPSYHIMGIPYNGYVIPCKVVYYCIMVIPVAFYYSYSFVHTDINPEV